MLTKIIFGVILAEAAQSVAAVVVGAIHVEAVLVNERIDKFDQIFIG